MEKKPSLTGRYAGLQACYWVVNCALFSFAAVYLQARGFRARDVGVILAGSTLLSAAAQPVVAAFADRSERVSLRALLALFSALCAAALSALFLLEDGSRAVGVVFFAAALLNDLMQPLLNALSIRYTDRGWPLQYSVGRSVGSLGFAAASAALGWLMGRWGGDSMLAVCLAAVGIFLALLALFPRAGGGAAVHAADRSCSLWQFFRKYRRFCLSLLGILFLACFHLMTEHYLYQMVVRVGGSERDLGLNLSISTLLEMISILGYGRLSRRGTTAGWMRVAAAGFFLKAVSFLLAGRLWMLYAAQVFQIFSFGIYAPASVRYAAEQVAPEDMVKGQAMVAAFFTCGGSLGNFLGGQVIDRWGVMAMLWTGAASAALGMLILFFTVRDKKTRAA